MNILVIDDDTGLRSVLQTFLQVLGYSVVVAKDGEEGLRTFKSGEFDLVFTDLVMPGAEGLEVIMQIKELKPGTPIIAITGYDKYSELATALDVDQVLYKPFTLDQVKASLDQYT